MECRSIPPHSVCSLSNRRRRCADAARPVLLPSNLIPHRAMPQEANKSSGLQPTPQPGWWYHGWASARIFAGVTGRSTSVEQLLGRLPFQTAVVELEQVHGGSFAVIEAPPRTRSRIPGCDALLTGQPGVALLVRTADCLPLVIADPSRGVVGVVHAGWRGLASGLPLRVIMAFRQLYHSAPEALRVGIGPAIRSCCYEVGPEFAARFGAFVQQRQGRWMCDLIGVAVDQLQRGGVQRGQVIDSGRCTSCEAQQWFSVRREGDTTGRLTSLIAIRP